MTALGRLVHHDPRSRQFAFPTLVDIPLNTVRHTHYGPVLDQGDIGACTGFAMAQWLNCKPAHLYRAPYITADQAYRFYSRATELDPFPGTWRAEPKPGGSGDDTGSSGLAACKAAQESGHITGYRWIFQGLPQLKGALQTSPVMVGTTWLTRMFTPNSSGYLDVSGSEAGGHEYVIVGWNARARYFTMLNSWSDTWGINGYARIPEQSMGWLLDQDGDTAVPEIGLYQ